MPLPEFNQLVDEAKSQISEIDPAQLKSMQQAAEPFTLIDVRERDEQEKGTIAGAVNLPRGILEGNIDQITTDKDRKLVLYCAGGSRSALAALNLKKMGFRHVLSLAGGYRGWRESETPYSSCTLSRVRGNHESARKSADVAWARDFSH